MSKRKHTQHVNTSSHDNGASPTKCMKTSRPSAVFKPTGGRHYTVSIAIPGSIISNAQTHDTKTALASTIARCAAVFCVDEIVVFNDGTTSPQNQHRDHVETDAASGYTAYNDPHHFLAHILSYLETPPHLRRRLFPHHPNLKTAGSMPSLDMPHHMRSEEWCRYREGVVIESNATVGSDSEGHSMVDAGLDNNVRIEAHVPEGMRVTVDLESRSANRGQSREYLGEAVAPSEPRERQGYYWGYAVRRAVSLSSVFTECPFEGGYDYCIGTSERGSPVQEFTRRIETPRKWNHLLIAFGGIAGLEAAVGNDAELEGKVGNPSDLFDVYLNLVTGQGSRTIRTEEAIWCACMGLKAWVEDTGMKSEAASVEVKAKNSKSEARFNADQNGNADIKAEAYSAEAYSAEKEEPEIKRKKKNRHKRT